MMCLKKSFPFSQLILAALLLFSLSRCHTDPAQTAVDAAIEAHGGSAFQRFHLAFDFRDRHYTATRENGLFTYTRSFTDSAGQIRDVYNNEGFIRFRNGTPVTLPPDREEAFTSSVNSVIYFALLPFGLNDQAVRKQSLGETIVAAEPYHTVRVTFNTEKGRDVHDDVYVYWFHREHHTMDYLAYSYKTEGGGIRFRKAVNPRRRGGILVQDYDNYRPLSDTIALAQLPVLFQAGRLEKVSDIDLRNVVVTNDPPE